MSASDMVDRDKLAQLLLAWEEAWEQGDDMSMVDFTCAEYSGGKMVADKGTIERILEVGIRRVARNSGVDRKTVALIVRGKAVKPS